MPGRTQETGLWGKVLDVAKKNPRATAGVAAVIGGPALIGGYILFSSGRTTPDTQPPIAGRTEAVKTPEDQIIQQEVARRGVAIDPAETKRWQDAYSSWNTGSAEKSVDAVRKAMRSSNIKRLQDAEKFLSDNNVEIRYLPPGAITDLLPNITRKPTDQALHGEFIFPRDLIARRSPETLAAEIAGKIATLNSMFDIDKLLQDTSPGLPAEERLTRIIQLLSSQNNQNNLYTYEATETFEADMALRVQLGSFHETSEELYKKRLAMYLSCNGDQACLAQRVARGDFLPTTPSPTPSRISPLPRT